MEKEVLIHVRGLQIADGSGEEQPIELVVPGEYYFRNGSHFLKYEEIMEGFTQPTVNFVKFSSRGMEVRKKGTVNANMVFQEGKRNTTLYATPFGTIEMGISATELEFCETEGSITLNAKYVLDADEAHVADCSLSIVAQRKRAEEFCL